jgi:hypothetical protein
VAFIIHRFVVAVMLARISLARVNENRQ